MGCVERERDAFHLHSIFANEASLGPNPFIGVIYHWIGGFASATNFIPFRGIKRWSWEIYWLIQGVAAWLIAPSVLAYLFVPHLSTILHESYAADPKSFHYAILFGILWGFGGLTFGLAIRYLGLALGYAIALGLCTFFGTIIPPIYYGQLTTIAHLSSGRTILAGLAVCLLAVAINGAAGVSKDKEFTFEEKQEAGEQDFSFIKGIAVAIFAGIMSSFFAFGLSAGKPIGDRAKVQLIASNRLDLWQNLPVLIVVLWGGFLTNFVWSAILILKNRSGSQFLGTPGLNPMRAAATSGDTLVDRQLPLRRPRRRHLVLPVLLLLHGPDQDGPLRVLQLDPPHGLHHPLRHPLGHRPQRMEGHKHTHQAPRHHRPHPPHRLHHHRRLRQLPGLQRPLARERH
jgi:L-rhamnose-H+ transport protein